MRRNVQDLVESFGPAVVWSGIGQVSAVEAHTAWGYLATVTLQPSGAEVQARILAWGARATGGAFWPVEEGDEVLVLFPDGDANRAVCIPGLTSSAAAPPTSWGNGAPLIVHPDGTTLATSETATTQAVVLESLLPDLQAALTEVQALLAAFGVPSTNLSNLIAALPTGYRSVGVLSE